MSLSSVSIRRPVLAIVMSLFIIIFGILGYTFLGVRELPNTERPIISVSTSFPGANASVVENQITEPLEEAINTIAGIVSMVSVSREGRSNITVEFDLGTDLNEAANDVRDRVSGAVRRLPADADAPVVQRADGDADPIVLLNIGSQDRDLLEVTEIADTLFKNRLQTIPGIARIDIWGQRQFSMRLVMDPQRLAAYQLSPLDVRDAVRRSNVELPSGLIEGDAIELSVRTLSRLGSDPEYFNNLVLKRDGDRVVRFRDVGEARLMALNDRTLLRRDGVPMVGLVIRPQVGANEIEIVDEFYRRLEDIKRDLPEDIITAIGFDTSSFIRQSISEVKQTIFLALCLVCLTIFLFLREWRSAVIPLITIPIALTGAFFVMYVAGFSINVLSLLGIVLAVGLVVDDAVVVLENIYAKIEQGLDPVEAGLKGIHEIFLAVVATTLALTAVFMPLVFLGGVTGNLFREFGITLAGAVIISSFVALTLTPMICTKLLKRRAQHPAFYRATEPFFKHLNKSYRNALEGFLQRRWLLFPLLAVFFWLMYFLYNLLPQELAPMEDRSLSVITVTGPQGANFEFMDEVMTQIASVVEQSVPERGGLIAVTSPGFGPATTTNTGFGRLTLIEPSERDRSQNQIVAQLSRDLREVPGAEIFVRQQPTIRAGGRGLPVSFVVQNPDFERIRDVTADFLQAARARPEFEFVNVDLDFNRPEIEVSIDRERAENLGVSISAIAETIQASLSGQRFGFFLRAGQQYEIIGQLDRGGRARPADLYQLTLRNNRGELITLDNVITVSEATSPAVLYRFDRFPAATFGANLAEGFTISQGIAAMREVAAEVLDETFSTALRGESKEFEDAGGSLAFIFVLALLLVYLVLAAQFESFRDPFIIMMTVPLAIVGGLFALWYVGLTLNIFSQIGLIMLIGLITKNGILLVEFANQRRDAGLDRMAAVLDAAGARFRPILMTAISTILGTLPIALALGAGSQSRMPLGVVVIGGMLLGTLFTLFVVPAAYSYFASPDATRSPTTDPSNS
ncbi:MAG: efflux RND transporter permease subunit [Verrucomicrobia bacterium]|nr:efflux RND transporter permease subunit [Verrucomicrobiota bacterium]